MRKILFRGKRKDNGEWIEGYYGYKDIIEKHFIMFEDITLHDSQRPYFVDIEVDPSTVGQYTGLEDKNVKKAFFGDIIYLVTTEGNSHTLPLWWNKELACVMVGNFSYQRLYESGFIQPSRLIFEILGNIHDNKDLIK